jgi:uncharacterized protein (TIGR02453 family)
MLGATCAFSGFRVELLEFLRALAVNNTREWFQAHSAEYQDLLMQPARELVLAMGERLQAEIAADVQADPRVHGSILAITRDTRFSKDKTPYKTYLDFWFPQPLEGVPYRECPGYFLRIAPDALMLGVGMHRFTQPAQAAYRRAIHDGARCEALERVAQTLGDEGHEVGGRALKRVPTGARGPETDWLKHTGLYASRTLPVPDELYSPALPGWCLAHYRRLAPLQEWLLETLRE